MANKIINNSKTGKEAINNRIANGGGVGSTDLLGILSFLIALSKFVNNKYFNTDLQC